MRPEDVRSLLEQVRSGAVDVTAAAGRLSAPAAADLDYATVDLQRAERCGFPEVIYCEGKTSEWAVGVARRLADAEQDCLATRVSAEQSAAFAAAFPAAEQDRLARTFWLPAGPPVAPRGLVAVVTAGTTDLPVAQEALVTAKALGAAVRLVVDVGVAGLHRLLRRRDELAEADVIVVAAGMDGALPSVVGGLFAVPVIAVPTSTGYGAAFGGVAALLTMLNACSANVVTVNIDAGFKAGYAAALIARRGVGKG